MLKKRLSIFVPAYNEQGNIEGAVKKIHSIVPKYCSEYEIIIVNDGSTDNTGKIINRLAKKDKKIKPLHNDINRSMGYSYFRAVGEAKFEYLMTIFGDDDHPSESIERILSKMGQADIIIPYYTNLHLSKTWLRHVISITYTHIVNSITGLTVGYYNGITLHKTHLVKQVPVRSTGFGFQCETIVYLLKNGATYLQVDVLNDDRKTGGTAAFKIKNIISVAKSFLRMYSHYKLNKKDFNLASKND